MVIPTATHAEGIAWRAHPGRCCWGAEVCLSRLNKHRIGRPSCLENPRPEGAELTNGERYLSISHP